MFDSRALLLLKRANDRLADAESKLKSRLKASECPPQNSRKPNDGCVARFYWVWPGSGSPVI